MGWAYDPLLIAANQSPTAGLLYMVRINANAGTVVSNIVCSVGTAGSGLTTEENFAGLYSQSGDLLSQTADQSTNWTSTGLKTMALTSQVTTTGNYVYAGFLANGTSVPQFGRASSAQGTAAYNANSASGLPGPGSTAPR